MKSMENKNRTYSFLRFFLYAFCGIATALPLVFGKLWVLSWIAPVPVIWNEFFSYRDVKHPKVRSWLRGLLFFFSYGFIVFSWFASIYPLDYLGYNKTEAVFVIVLAMVGLPLIQSAFSALIFVFINAVRNRVNTYVLSVCSAFLVSIAEWLQTKTFAGIPWGRMAIGQIENRAVIQSASLFGSYFVSFIIILVSCLLAVSAHSFGIKKTAKGTIAFVAALLIFFVNALYGFFRISHVENISTDTIKVAAVQGNIPFEDRYFSNAEKILSVYTELTTDAADEGADLILWPETAIPFDLYSIENYDEYLTDLQKTVDTDIMATIFISEDDGLYNAVFPVTDDGINKDYYSKRHLVPFGEYVPYENIIEKICPPLARFAAIDFPLSAGDSAHVFQLDSGKVSCLVCFDSIFENLCMEGIRDGSQLICVSTNDSWFTGSSALKQHNYHTALRCVEFGRFGVRAANTGISSIISPTGEITASLVDGERGIVTGDVRMISDMTLYSRVGNIIIPVGTAFLLCVFTFAVFGKKNGKNDGISD